MTIKAMLAAAALASVSFGISAHASTYDFGTLNGDSTQTSDTINHGSGSFVDTFSFNTANPLTEFSTGAFTEAAPFSITSADLTLYNSANVALATTGAFDPATSAIPTLTADLGSGSYHLLADITVPGGSTGSYTVTATTVVSAAPEPAVWALLFSGVGAIGLALRYGQRKSTLAPA